MRVKVAGYPRLGAARYRPTCPQVGWQRGIRGREGGRHLRAKESGEEGGAGELEHGIESAMVEGGLLVPLKDWCTMKVRGKQRINLPFK